MPKKCWKKLAVTGTSSCKWARAVQIVNDTESLVPFGELTEACEPASEGREADCEALFWERLPEAVTEITLSSQAEAAS